MRGKLKMNSQDASLDIEMKLIELCYTLNDALALCVDIEIDNATVKEKIMSFLLHTIEMVNSLLEGDKTAISNVYILRREPLVSNA
jgi:hypothetical protein